MEFVRKCKYSVQDFLKLVKRLRYSNAGRWGRSQTHASIRSDLIEESYEALEAIDLGDKEMLKEELGDILLQIAFHCNIEEEENGFSFEEVVDKICRKIVCKNPHIFSSDYCVSENRCHIYDIRERERCLGAKKSKNRAEISADEVKKVSRILPALMRSVKVQERAARSGYGLFSIEDALNETFERLHYLETLILRGKQENYDKELGDLLFSMTEISRLVNVDAESALYDSCERFKNEFLYKISLENRNKV